MRDLRHAEGVNEPTRQSRRRRRLRIRPRLRRATLRELFTANLAIWLLALVLWDRCGLSGCPNVERLSSYQPGGATVLLDRTGSEFANLAPMEHDVVALAQLPPHVPAAFVAIEDRRFYGHGGVDLQRVIGAAAANLRAGAVAEGFSTITMQLARNVWPEELPARQRTVRRKLLEMRIAFDIERHFTKQEILQLYLNHIYFGSGAHGIASAAHNYFGKSAAGLSLSEAALLAALPKSPALFNPRRFDERARERRNLVLGRMARQEWITTEAAAAASATDLHVLRDPPVRTSSREPIAAQFAEAVRRILEEELGQAVYTRRLQVHTTLDRNMQEIAERELNRQLESIEAGRYGSFDPHAEQVAADSGTQALQGAVVVMEADSGDVRALVGGRDHDASQFDRATRARRPAGTAMQPFVYATALAQGFAPSQHIADDTLRIELPDGSLWEPQNFTNDFEGHVTMREAVVEARSVPAVRLAHDAGIENIARLARRAGLRGAIADEPTFATHAAEVTPLELTAAYTMFANGGVAVRPRLVTRVLDEEGAVLWQPVPRRNEVLPAAVAYVVTDMLQDAMDEGVARPVRAAGFRSAAAGYPAATNENTDAWFVGYTPDLVTGVWVGFDQPRPIVDQTNALALAAPAWGRLMRAIYDERSTPPAWTVPAGVAARRVEPATGLVLLDGCSALADSAYEEWFIAGQEPAATCPGGAPAVDTRGAVARLGDWAARMWRRTTRLVARHFGSEEAQPVPPQSEDRFLGAPLLPRAIDLPVPVVAPDSFLPAR